MSEKPSSTEPASSKMTPVRRRSMRAILLGAVILGVGGSLMVAWVAFLGWGALRLIGVV